MNIGVAGARGHDYENFYDELSQTLIWFSKPNSHSSQPLWTKIISGELTLYFFARWAPRSPFTFLGTGSIDAFTDGYRTQQGYDCIRVVVTIKELQDIISSNLGNPSPREFTERLEEGNLFLLEKHLEDFLVSNWDKTPLALEYENYEKDGEPLGQQYRTETGPIDILGQKKDKSGFLVVELKRDRASDIVVGQTLRYMGWVKEHLCEPTQNVTGCIIAQGKDAKLDYALKPVGNIDFMRYEVDFRLIR